MDFFQVSTNTVTVPTEAMRNGDFSQLLGTNPFYSSPQVIRDPLTGLPFPGNIIPANRLSPNGIAMMKLYPLPTPGFQSGSNNLIQNSDNPREPAEGQPPVRLPAGHEPFVHLPLLEAELHGD